jgi:hypothetical protein
MPNTKSLTDEDGIDGPFERRMLAPAKTRRPIPVITAADVAAARLKASVETAQHSQEECIAWLTKRGEHQLAGELAKYLGCEVPQ